jgi:hypothetical protein
MSKELFFAHGRTIGLGPGKAAAVDAGEVLMLDDDKLAARLLKQPGVTLAGEAHAKARRVTLKERLLAPGQAAQVSPPIDEDLQLAEYERKNAVRALRERLAAEKAAFEKKSA